MWGGLFGTGVERSRHGRGLELWFLRRLHRWNIFLFRHSIRLTWLRRLITHEVLSLWLFWLQLELCCFLLWHILYLLLRLLLHLLNLLLAPL